MIIGLDYGSAPPLQKYILHINFNFIKRKTMKVLAWTAASGYRYRYAAHNISLMQTLLLHFKPYSDLTASPTLSQPLVTLSHSLQYFHSFYYTITAYNDILKASASTFTAFATILKLL